MAKGHSRKDDRMNHPGTSFGMGWLGSFNWGLADVGFIGGSGWKSGIRSITKNKATYADHVASCFQR